MRERKTIQRKIVTTEITGLTIDYVDGKPVAEELPVLVAVGRLDDKKALQALYKEYGKTTQISLGKLETKTAMYEIPIEKFIENATKITQL